MAKKNNKVEAVEPVSNPLDDARIKDLKRLEDFPSTGENLLQHALLMTHMQIVGQLTELNTKFAELVEFMMLPKVEGK
jgi:hypothetical protein|tara:strand:+ start:27 stop:260 length:234 start_codon:yes stop_codon:yes gene_type:complete